MRKKIELSTIFEASRKVFADFDFKKATLQDIADELSVTNSNLYLYFDGKRALYDATIAYYLDLWIEKCFASTYSMKDPRQQMNFLMKNAILYLTEDVQLSAMLKNDDGIMDDFARAPHLAGVYEKIISRLSAIVQSGADFDLMRGLDFRATAEALFKLYVWMVIRPALRGEDVSNSVLEDIVKYGLFVTGL